MIKLYEEKYYKDDFDYFIIEEGNKILARANRTINALDEDMYLKLILRSMNNYEICLGKVDEGNLKKDGMIICIRSTRYISYNMLEHDCYNYIKRLKKKGYSGNVMEIVNDFFTKIRNQEMKVQNYIRVLVNYPIEAIKILSKIKYDRSRFTNDEWVKEINMSQRIDGIELYKWGNKMNKFRYVDKSILCSYDLSEDFFQELGINVYDIIPLRKVFAILLIRVKKY